MRRSSTRKTQNSSTSNNSSGASDLFRFATSKAGSKEMERIDALFYTYADKSFGMIELNEAAMHFGESIKEIINEDFGDGIISAIDFYCSVDKVQGVDGKDRVVVTFDDKYLPYREQKFKAMVSKPKLK